MSIPFCTEIKVLGGVKLPRSVRCFDVRIPDDEVFKDCKPYGEHLWSSERAAYVLGLRTSWSHRYDTSPVSCQAYEDFRTCSEARLALVAQNMRKMLREYLREYRLAERFPAGKGEGGSCYYKPVALTLANYGYGLMCDERTKLVRAFSYNAKVA